MSSPQTGASHTIVDGGIAARHAAVEQPPVRVAPATGDEHNTLRPGIIAVACWRVEDLRFEFDSSFVGPAIKTELALLAKLVQEHPPASKAAGQPGSPLSVFGHADPVGNDDYNKQLSGRRAAAIYALLVRDADLWEKLFSQPLGNDDWGSRSLQVMLGTVSPTAPGESNEQQAAQLQRDAAGRRNLFIQYMDALCGPELRLEKEDFLAQGDDAAGKGDFQGCSEFNPVMIFSQQEHQKFEQAKSKTERNQENAPNRRVMVLFFRKGARVDPAKWPCPRATEGPAACRKRFWSDGEKRRTTRLPDARRVFDQSKDTFACRFYQRISTGSPCETILPVFRIRLYDHRARPLPFAPCLITQAGREPRPDRASGSGQAGQAAPSGSTPEAGEEQGGFITLRDLKLPATVNVKWSRPRSGDGPGSPKPSASDEFEFELDVAVDIPEDNPEQAALTRLTNMGYVRGPTRTDDVREFQRDYKPRFPAIEVDGRLNPATQAAIREVHDACDLVQKP
jgi:hypothetical protein